MDLVSFDLETVDHLATGFLRIGQHHTRCADSQSLATPRQAFDDAILNSEWDGRRVIGARPSMMNTVYPIDARPDAVPTIDDNSGTGPLADHLPSHCPSGPIQEPFSEKE